MAVFHFTIHAYRSWRPDHPRGYTKKGEGYQPPDSGTAQEYDQSATQDPVEFTDQLQRELLHLTHQICDEERWRLEGAGFDLTHMHLAISWSGFVRWEEVDRRLKNLLALKLNRKFNTPGKRWFARRHGAPRRVQDEKHLQYLLTTYFPDHSGVLWKRGTPLPSLRP